MTCQNMTHGLWSAAGSPVIRGSEPINTITNHTAGNLNIRDKKHLIHIVKVAGKVKSVL